MNEDLLTGGLLALGGAVLGFVLSRLEKWIEERAARRTIATALLAELRWLEGMFHQIHEYGPSSFYDPLEHPALLHAIDNLALFGPRTAERLTHFHNLLRDVQAAVNQYRENRPELRGSRQEIIDFIKAKTVFAAGAVGDLAGALRDVGGQMPDHIKERPIEGGRSALPPRAFESFSSRDS